jgi:beta-lactamase superfamily II metal-dependent hydrolase
MSRYSKDVLKVDVFKYPHHGENVVSDKFIDIISPKYVIVPGFNKSRMKINFNKFNSMSSEVLLVGNKDNVGNVLIESDGSNLTVTKMFNP